MQEKNVLFSTYQWAIIASCFVMLALGSSLNFNFGIFLKPLSEEFGWSRSSISAGFSIFMITGSASAILAGAMADKYGTRRVVIVGTLLITLAMIFASRLQSIWEFYLLIGVISGLGRSAFNTPILAFIQRSFTQNRGLATGLAGAGGGLGILITAPILGYLIAAYGWRLSYAAMGSTVLLLTLPAVWFIKSEKNVITKKSANGAKSATFKEAATLPEASLGVKEIMKRRPFWTVLGSHACDCMCHSVLLVHIVPFAIESGMPRVQAAMLMSALGAGALVGRLVGGMMSDRFGPKGTLLLFLSMQTFPVPLLLFSPGLGTMYFVAIFVGLGLGGHGTLYPLVTREFYGPKRVGLLYGTFTMGASIGMASGSFFGGVLYDMAGDYSWAFLYSFTLGVISLLLVWTYPNRTYLAEPSAETA
ncbi:MAG: MFS transporter [Nitrospinaceae bacterium]|nr:MFS transporter [Nitrospinaceae bacterium]